MFKNSPLYRSVYAAWELCFDWHLPMAMRPDPDKKSARVEEIVNPVYFMPIFGALAGLLGLLIVGYAGSTTLNMAETYTLLSLAAITIGGGMLGVTGMLLGVPLAAALYRMLCLDVSARAKGRNVFDMPLEQKKKSMLFK